MASPRKMATRENGKLARKQRDCPKLLGIVGPFLARFIKILPKSPKNFKFFIYFRVLTKATAILI